MRPFSTKELDEIRKAVDGGHHLEFVERLMATIDSLEMSEGEYQAMCDWEPSGVPGSLNERDGYWRTRDGRVLEIAKMSDAHLGNAIRLFERSGWGEHPKIQELREELRKR